MFGSMVGFRGRRIKWRYFRFEQIQYGGRRHLGKNSNGHVHATFRPIHFMFGSLVVFSGTANLMALFLPTTCTDGQLTLPSETTSHHSTVDA